MFRKEEAVSDLTKIGDEFINQWIAMSPENRTIVASGLTVREALDEAKKKGIDSPILTKVPSRNQGYIL